MATTNDASEVDHPLVKKTPSRGISEEFWQAINEENIVKVVSFLNIVDINWRNDQAEGMTPLHVAVKKNNTIIVALLLGRGADISLRDDIGK